MNINTVGSFSPSLTGVQQASERVASGQRINSAADDAAGLAIANRLNSQVAEFSRSVGNSVDGISFLQVAEGGLSSINANLERIQELSLQSLNGTLNDSDRRALNQEFVQLRDEIAFTVENTQFNETPVFNNEQSVRIQLGDDESGAIEVGLENFSSLITDNEFEGLDISTSEGAQETLDFANQFKSSIDSGFAEVGGQINRLESSISSLLSGEITAESSRSRIEDADVAREVTNLTQEQLRTDISVAIQSQSNQRSADVLRLLSF